ncbi:MAG: thioredoxin [Candidatus Altimarinota bacterium]
MTYTSTDNNFARDIEKGVVLVDFWAPWCGPCQMMGPILEELAKVMDGKMRVMKHNVDNEPNVPNAFQIRSIPTMILFQDGKPVEKVVGVKYVDELKTLIEKYL